MHSALSTRPFGVAETHGVLKLAGAEVGASSDGLNWRSLYVSAQTEAPFSGQFVAKDLLFVLFRTPADGRRLADGSSLHAPAGSVRVVPSGVPLDVDLKTSTDTVHLYLRRSVWEEVAMDMTDGEPGGIMPEPGWIASEPLLFALADAAVAAAHARCTDPSFSDHLARSMASHMLATHVGLRIKRRRTSSSGQALSREVARAVDFIEANADRSIGLQEIAGAAIRSPSHLARTFASEVGMPPHRYLIAVRVKRARQLLARTDAPIAEIAFECGFTHQEHLTRLFRRHFDTTPAAFRRALRS